MPLYVVENGSNDLQAWDVDGTRHTADDIALGTGEWSGATATADRIYVVDTAVPDHLRAWDHNGARQSGDDITLGAGAWGAAAATVDRIYALDNTSDHLRAWDHNGARQSGDDISLGTGQWQGATATDTYIYTLNDTNNFLLARDYSGVRQTDGDISLGTGTWRGATATADRIYALNNLFDAQTLRAYDHSGARQAADDITLPDITTYGGACYVADIPDPAQLAAAGTAATGGSGSAGLRVDGGEPVELAATGTPATGGTGSANLTVVTPTPPLTLADFDSAGLDVDALALITARGGPDIYADSNRGGSQTPDDGELGLGVGETLITRISVLDSGGRVRLNDNNVPVTLSLRTFFGNPNTTSDWTLTIQTATHVATSDQLAGTTQGAANFTFSDADDIAALNGIASGDLFILAVAQPAASSVSLAAAGTPSTGGGGSAALIIGSAGSLEIAAAGQAAAGGDGSASLTAGGGGSVGLAATGQAATGGTGSAALRVGDPGSLDLAAQGVAATGGAGSAGLTVGGGGAVMLAASGQAAGGSTGSAALAVVDVPAAAALAATGVAAAAGDGSADLAIDDPPPAGTIEIAATGAAAAAADGSADLAVQSPLVLADFDSAGLDVDALALIEAAAPSTIYADSNRGGTQTPEDGELGLGAGETLITRVRVLDSGARISLNDNNVPVTLNLRTFFGDPNTTSEWTLTIQTRDHVATSDQLAAMTAAAANFTFSDADDIAALNGIAAGDRFLLAVAQAQTVVTLAAQGQAPTAGVGSADLIIAEPTGVTLAAAGQAASAGDGSAGLRVTDPGNLEIAAAGVAAAAQAGRAGLTVDDVGAIALAASGTAAAGGDGSARLVRRGAGRVLIAVAGAPASGGVGVAAMIVVDVPQEIAATGDAASGGTGSSDVRVRDPAPDALIVVAVRPPPTLQVLLRDRRTWRPIAILERWSAVRFTERWREPGEGMITILADDLPPEADAALVTGAAAVDVTVRDVDDFGEAIVDGMVGPVTAVTLADGDFVRLHLPFAQIRNEIAAEGKEAAAGLPATRPARRVFSAASQAAYGCREEYVDARQADTPADLTGVAAIRLAERVGLDLEATAGGEISGRGFTVQIAFTDALGILRARHVDATGVAAVQNPGTTAGAYIAGLLEDNLLAPAIGRRAADFAAGLRAGASAVGEAVHLPLRWPTLADAVRDIGIAGLVGLRATLEGDAIEYRVTALRDRTAATGDRTAVVTNVVDVRHRIEPGDLVTVAPWIRRDAAGPAVELTQVCSARTFAAAPGQPLTIRPTLGEPASIARLLLAESRRNQPARTS